MNIRIIFIQSYFVVFFSFLALGQKKGVQNYGNMQLHNKGLVGFHTNFTNNGIFDKNLGLIGFYHSAESLNISGAISPSFYDFEMAVEQNLFIDVSININNSLNFIYGDVKSSRNNKNVYIKLTEKAIHDGAMNLSKMDGNLAIEGQKKFSFPIGYNNIIRPLQVDFIDGPFFAKCEYFHENPDYPQSFLESFDIKKKEIGLDAVSSEEFWNLTTSGLIQITLNWNSECNLSSSVKNLENITVVGWSKKNNRWDNLGSSKLEGSIEEGSITSNILNANNYEIFTFGFLFDLNANNPGNYIMTPNDDGINDSFTLKILEQSPNNEFKIFNRTGRLVFEKTNYKNEFRGISNKNTNKGETYLPQGVYFYILELKDLGLEYQGYFYIAL